MSSTPTRPLPPAVRDKLAKLVPLLSSNHNGERAGALAAIDRVLKSAGLDWHDFTGWLTAPTSAALPPPRTEVEMSMLDHELVALIEVLRASCRFTPRSEDFLDSLLDRAGRFDVVHLSPKQKRWLDDLVLKARL